MTRMMMMIFSKDIMKVVKEIESKINMEKLPITLVWEIQTSKMDWLKIEVAQISSVWLFSLHSLFPLLLPLCGGIIMETLLRLLLLLVEMTKCVVKRMVSNQTRTFTLQNLDHQILHNCLKLQCVLTNALPVLPLPEVLN